MTSSTQPAITIPRSTNPHSPEMRSRVLHAIFVGKMSRRAAARQFGVGEATAIRWAETYERTGRTEALPKGGDHRSGRMEERADIILSRIEEVPDATIMELVEWLEEEHGFKSSYGAVWNFLKRHSQTVKKKRSLRARSSAPASCSSTGSG